MGKPNKQIHLNLEEVVKSYKHTKNVYETAEKFNVSRATLHRYLSKNKIEIRRKLKYVRNSYCFDTLSEQSMYWLGFLATDGHITRGHNLKVYLWNKDKPHLEKLQKFLETDAPVTDIIQTSDDKKYYGCSLSLIDKYIHKALTGYNFTHNKTYTYKIPDIILNHPDFRHFIRGCFDGDGWIRAIKDDSGKVKLMKYGLCGASQLVPQIHKHLIDTLGLNETYLEKVVNTYNFTFAAHRDTYRLYHYLYDGATVWLDRKKEAADYSDEVFKNSKKLYHSDQEYIDTYNKTKSIPQTAEILGCSYPTVKDFLRKNNLLQEKEKPTYNYNFFDVNNLTEESMYWAGYLSINSCIKQRPGWDHAILILNSNNPSIIDNFVANSNFKIPVYKQEDGAASLEIKDQKIIEQLNKFNINKNKKNNYIIPDFVSEHKLFRHFIRGRFDGKGSCKNKEMYMKYEEKVFNYIHGNIKEEIKYHIHDDVVKYYCGNKYKILHFLYSDAKVYKQDRYEDYLKMKQTLPATDQSP